MMEYQRFVVDVDLELRWEICCWKNISGWSTEPVGRETKQTKNCRDETEKEGG